MRAVFNNVTRTASIDGDSVNVYPFYNADAMVPPKWKTTTFAASHNHYITSGNTPMVSADVDDLLDLLYHHGYTQTRGYRVVLMANPQEASLIRAFNTATGAKYTFLPSANVGGGVIIPANAGVVGAPSLVNLPGLISIGTYGAATIIEEEYIPPGYLFAFATAGEQQLGNPVGIRQHENASLRGLRLVKGRDNDYPLIDSFYLHGMGTGVRHRGAGAVMQITASGTYTIPTLYQ
jgi:hypothetical protein